MILVWTHFCQSGLDEDGLACPGRRPDTAPADLVSYLQIRKDCSARSCKWRTYQTKSKADFQHATSKIMWYECYQNAISQCWLDSLKVWCVRPAIRILHIKTLGKLETENQNSSYILDFVVFWNYDLNNAGRNRSVGNESSNDFFFWIWHALMGQERRTAELTEE